MAPTILALLLLAGSSRADEPIGTIDGGPVGVGEHRVSIGLKGGASFLAGGQGAAYAPGPATGLLVDFPFSEYAGFTIGLGYATHRVRDANALFEQDDLVLPIDPANVTGNQHHLQGDIGLRFDLNMSDPTRYKPRAVTAAPWFRLAVGASMTDTLLYVASTGGREPARTRRAHALLCPAIGFTVNLPRLVSFGLSLQSITMFGLDHDEVENTDAVRAVFRFQPALDVLFRF